MSKVCAIRVIRGDIRDIRESLYDKSRGDFGPDKSREMRRVLEGSGVLPPSTELEQRQTGGVCRPSDGGHPRRGAIEKIISALRRIYSRCGSDGLK